MTEGELARIQYNLKFLPGPWEVWYAKTENPMTWGDKSETACEKCGKEEEDCCQKLAYGEYQVLAPGGRVVCWLDDLGDATMVAGMWKDMRDLLSEVQLLRMQKRQLDKALGGYIAS